MPSDETFSGTEPDNGQPGGSGEAQTEATGDTDDTRGTAFWRRVLYMIGYGFIGYFVLLALFVVAVVQAIYTLVSGHRSQEVATLAHNLNRYLTEVMGFVSWASDDKPFPAKPFPDETP
jgi:hypothetical protein